MTSPKFTANPSDSTPESQPSKQIALPVAGKTHTFVDLANLVLFGALLGSSVCILCLTADTQPVWQAWLKQHCLPTIYPQTLVADERTLTDWASFFDQHSFEMIILSGATAELQANRLSAGYLAALVKAMPTEMVVMA